MSLHHKKKLALKLAVGVTAAVALPVQAQDEPQKIQRVEITGSSIKRIDAETALPVQIIGRDDIDKSGVTTAAELLKNISANTAPLSDGASITDGTSGQRGFNGANLRGIGVSSTLVLLNGRRLANFASPGDNAGVDLNNIPAGAIQRVEVLKDGASAIYGTDAIGGVINFITRKDYTGVEMNASVAGTQEGGAGKRTASISAGHGNLQNDRFNLFGVLDVQKLDSLRSSQRDFIQERPLAANLPALMSSNTYPANIDISSAQRAALIAAGVLPAGSTANRINPSAPDCAPPATVYAPKGPGGKLGCSYDYMEDTEIYPKASKIGFIGRATFQASADHQVFLELVQSQAKSDYVLSPNPQRIRNLPVSLLPEKFRAPLSAAGLPTTFSGIRYRMMEAGNRTNQVTSDAQRLVLGATGTVGGWDYDLGLSRAENKAVDKYVNGYVLFDKFDAGVRSGIINPFGPSSKAGQDLINSIKVNDEARKSKGTSTAIDGKLSTTLATLEGGDLGLAIGAEARRERSTFTPSALLLSNNIAGDRDTGLAAGSTTDLVATDDGRTVASVYGEINAPISKQLELQGALRYDHYTEVGSTVNPKLGVRWQPAKQLVLRGSAGTGFRAPSLSDLKRPTTYGSASSFLTDPVCVKTGLDSIDGCTDQYPVERRSNPNLKPEKSRQFSLGVALEAAPGLNLTVDYWDIRKKDVISTLGEQIIVDNAAKYEGKYIERDGDGYITNIILQKENQGKLNTSGVDLGVDYKTANSAAGRFSVNATGTLVLKYDRQFGPLEAERSNLGLFLNDQVIQKWRHRISFGWDRGPFNATLSNQFSSGYTDQNTTYDPVADSLLPSRRVKPYSLWDLTGSWAVSKQLKVRAGVLNLGDTAPPYSNQAYYFLAGYDPTYTDPRGRSAFISVSYAYK
ncbi:TonB-dependent receptor [Pseudoduganella sp. FT55W]|uniref:TonB-dependent receptor n=1 Tax=Duganella rivi TaxID=2666083 RepID=A0A7X4GPB0_9BURK|nr:TonB-dependent receptor [Duganella rivi]MYM67153.1 TonB-dependent receptor [Duganella rivi]